MLASKYANLNRLPYFLAFFFTHLEVVIVIGEKLKFDSEYSTQWSIEQKYLHDHGIRYSFVKTIDGVTTWKYTKNYQLFKTLTDFYSTVYSK